MGISKNNVIHPWKESFAGKYVWELGKQFLLLKYCIFSNILILVSIIYSVFIYYKKIMRITTKFANFEGILYGLLFDTISEKSLLENMFNGCKSLS